MDRDYYSRKIEIDSGWAVRSTEGDDYDSNYVPFFPNGFQAGFATQFTDAQTSLFKEWTAARAKNLPDELILRTRIMRQGRNPPEFTLPAGGTLIGVA
jgi:hypothetical protein